MKLVFLHGSPATGKLTVAKALLRMVPGRLSDNHAVIDFARTIFDFGAPGFWELVHSARCSAIDAAAEHGLSLLVTTFCYGDPDDRQQFDHFEEIVRQRGGELLPVFLRCREEAVRRVGNPDRVERRKMTSGPRGKSSAILGLTPRRDLEASRQGIRLPRMASLVV
jgi:hypothetical protein